MAAVEQERAQWSTAFINNLPDSSFLYIESGGSKDSDGKTTPRSLRHFPVKDGSGAVDLPHLRNALARIPQSSLPASVKAAATAKAQKMLAAENKSAAPPRDNLVRAVFPGPLELRQAADEEMPTMEVGFARYNEWTEISSVFEGHFMERVAPGAFKKTISENLSNVRALFNHGSDPQIGNKVLGPITDVRDGEDGPVGIVPLLDTSYNRDLVPGLKAGVYGSSFRFRVTREDYEDKPKRSADNPQGLPERTITEAHLMEFGPVTFPAYAGATAGVRSLTDQFRVAEFVGGLDREKIARMDTEDLHTLACMISMGTDYIDEQDEPEDQANIPVMETVLKTLASLVPVEVSDTEPADEPEDEGEMNSTSLVDTVTAAAPPHPDSPRRGTQTDKPAKPKDKEMTIEEMVARQEEIKRELEELASESRGSVLSATDQARWDGLVEENDDLTTRIEETAKRDAYIDGLRTRAVTDTAVQERVNITRPKKDETPSDPFDVASYHGLARDQDHMTKLLREGAKRAAESFDWPDERTDVAKAEKHLERALHKDSPSAELAKYVLNVGSPTYRSAFAKYVGGASPATMTQAEQRSLGIATQGGQMPVPIQIDPTVTLTSNGVINPLRQISRNVTMTGYEWRGVATQGVTAAYSAEGAVVPDGSPTLVQPTIDAERATCFVPFSYEVGQDWAGLESELGGAIADAKDVLEATQFLTGAGHASSAPKGVLRSSSTVIGTALNTNAGTVFTVQNIYELSTALPPRFQPGASWVANRAVFNRVRQFDTAGGASLWIQLQNQFPATLIGYPSFELTTMSTAVPSGTGATWGIFGDFSQFVIADRIGMSINIIPNLFNGNTAGGLAYPVGMQGLFAFWRNSSDVMTSNAFRAGTQS